jgi:tetratricopeptide (TPR) repeat protein
MTRTLDAWSTVVILAVVQLGVTANSVAAPTTSDQLPFDWPSASHRDAENAKAQALADKGRAAYLAGDFATAVSDFSELLKLKPADARAYYNRGNAYYRMRNLERALADFSEAVKIAPDLHLALMNRGNIYSQFERYDEAIADYSKALAVKPDQFLIYSNRGIAFSRLGDNEKALRDFKQAISLNPQDAISYASRGDIFYRHGEFEQARKDYLKAVELDSSLSHAAERLRTIAVGTVEPAGPAQSVDTSTIATIVLHQQAIERLVRLAKEACLLNGEDEYGLAALAADGSWAAVGDVELKKASNALTTMVNSWTLSEAVGNVAIMQSKVNTAPGVYICSMTAKVGSPRILEDFRAEFEKQFKTAAARPVEQAGDTKLQYWLPHKAKCDAQTSIVMSLERGAVTVRMLHGRKADGG